MDIFKIIDWTKQRKQFSRDVVFVGTLIFNRSWTTTNHSTRNIVFTTFHNKDHLTCLHTTRDIQRETQLVLTTGLFINLTILLFTFNPWKSKTFVTFASIDFMPWFEVKLDMHRQQNISAFQNNAACLIVDN